MRFGTVDWLFREYKQTKAYLEKVSSRSRRDYERTMLLVTDLVTKKGDRVGDRKIKAISPVSADRIYELIVAGPHGPRPRQGEKVVGLCARAWSVVHRLYADVFNQDIPNPWRGVTKNWRTKATKRQLLAIRSTLSPKQRSQRDIQKRQLQQLFASNGCNAPRTSWQAISGGRTTGAVTRPRQSEFSITRLEKSFFTRFKIATALFSTAMLRMCLRRFLAAAFR